MTRPEFQITPDFLRFIKSDPNQAFLDEESIAYPENIQKAADLIWILADYYNQVKNPVVDKHANPTAVAVAGYLYDEVVFEMPSIKLVEWGLTSDVTTESIIARHNRKINAHAQTEEQPTPHKPPMPFNRIRIRFDRKNDPITLTLTETYIQEENTENIRTDSLIEEETMISRIKEGVKYNYTITTKRKIVEQEEISGGEKRIKSDTEISRIPEQNYLSYRSINTTIAFLTEAIMTYNVLPKIKPRKPYWDTNLQF